MPTTATSDLLPGYYIHEPSGSRRTLPWPTDPGDKQALLESSIGPQVIAWAEGRTDEPGLTHYLTGDPWRFTDGQKRFLIQWYSVTPEGRWRWRSGVKRGAKGTGKDPGGAAWCLIELLGPSRFEGWDHSGRPVGTRHMMPLVQIAANSEDQAKDVLRIANAMVGREARHYYGLDCGETRTILNEGGGRLEILTASEKSSEGDPATAIMLNESHHMTETSGGHRLAAVARRNIGKSPASIQARLVEFTNAHRQGYDSVAEQSYEAWQLQQRPNAKRRDILYDSIEASPTTDLVDDRSRRAGIEAAYSDAPWADVIRLEDEMLDTRTSVADSIRFYLNGLGTEEDAWVEPKNFDALALAGEVVADRTKITLFLDCSKSGDATGLVACRLSDGFVFVIDSWQRPHGDLGKGWLVPREQVDAAVRATIDRFVVMWFGVDPSPAKDDETEALYWLPLVDAWHRDFHKRLRVWATPGAKGHSVKFDMRLSQLGGSERNRLFTEAAMQVAHDIDEDIPAARKTFRWDGDSRLRVHTHNARRRTNKWGVSLGKINRDSKKLVDLAVCMVGARMGRTVVLNSGAKAGKSNQSAGKQKVVILS